jgi:hypothetical protein
LADLEPFRHANGEITEAVSDLGGPTQAVPSRTESTARIDHEQFDTTWGSSPQVGDDPLDDGRTSTAGTAGDGEMLTWPEKVEQYEVPIPTCDSQWECSVTRP